MRDIDAAKIRRLDGGLLLIFRELLRRRRATEAAAVLGLSSPAVSHALARLRDLFGDPLFVRRPHGLEPTKRALELGPKIEALIELADGAMRGETRFDPRSSTRRFLAAAPDFVAALSGVKLLEQMRDTAPNVSFVMASMSHDAAHDALKRGEIDLAIGRFTSARPGFTIEPLYEDRYCVVVRKGHPDLRRKISLTQYREAGHIFSWSPGEGGEGDEPHRAASIRMLAVVPRWLTVLSMVASCDGIATVPRRLAERHKDVFGLVILDAPFVGDRVAVSAVRRAGLNDPGADWFLGQVRRATS